MKLFAPLNAPGAKVNDPRFELKCKTSKLELK